MRDGSSFSTARTTSGTGCPPLRRAQSRSTDRGRTEAPPRSAVIARGRVEIGWPPAPGVHEVSRSSALADYRCPLLIGERLCVLRGCKSAAARLIVRAARARPLDPRRMNRLDLEYGHAPAGAGHADPRRECRRSWASGTPGCVRASGVWTDGLSASPNRPAHPRTVPIRRWIPRRLAPKRAVGPRPTARRTVGLLDRLGVLALLGGLCGFLDLGGIAHDTNALK